MHWKQSSFIFQFSDEGKVVGVWMKDENDRHTVNVAEAWSFISISLDPLHWALLMPLKPKVITAIRPHV
jgi:hypothetical protein